MNRLKSIILDIEKQLSNKKEIKKYESAYLIPKKITLSISDAEYILSILKKEEEK